VGRLSDLGWGMVRAPEHIRLSELVKLFLLNTTLLPKHAGDADIRAWFASLEKRMSEPGDLTLRDIWSK
jgi:hypothetical protein